MQVSGGAGKGGAMDDLEPFYPLKEGEEAHWEVSWLWFVIDMCSHVFCCRLLRGFCSYMPKRTKE